MSKKSKKTRSLLPKRIGGVKVPKALRKGRAAAFITSPVGVALMSQALAAAGALTAVKKADPDSTVGHLRDDPKGAAHDLMGQAKAGGQHSTEALRGAFSAAAEAFAEALRSSAEAIESGSKKSPGRDPLQAH
jgi:hypothetical protein